MVALPLLVLVIAVVALGMGRLWIAPVKVVRILVDNVIGLGPDWSDTEANVVERLRAPRVVLSLLIGGGLACCGAVLQGVLRNPLVAPRSSASPQVPPSVGRWPSPWDWELPFSCAAPSCSAWPLCCSSS